MKNPTWNPIPQTPVRSSASTFLKIRAVAVRMEAVPQVSRWERLRSFCWRETRRFTETDSIQDKQRMPHLKYPQKNTSVRTPPLRKEAFL